MAQTGYTPISIYYSSTTTNVPTAGNLVAGELAINTADGKLFYKDSAGAVQVIGTKGGVGSSTTTQVLYNSSGLVVGSANLTFNGTTLTTANDASISGLTVGKGGGAQGGNTALGASALAANTTGNNNVAAGIQALLSNTTGFGSAAVGVNSLYSNTTGTSNTALGTSALFSNTTASNNTAVGYQAGYSQTSPASGYNLYLGYKAGYSNVTSDFNTYIGGQAGQNATGSNNTFVGINTGNSTTGSYNTFIGANTSTGSSGQAITTGNNNTILGPFSGNGGGLDIRTASNYIVLSDGSGNPRLIGDGAGSFGIGSVPTSNPTLGLTLMVSSASYICVGHPTGSSSGNTYANFLYNGTNIGTISQAGTTGVLYNVTSDYRLKDVVNEISDSGSRIDALQPINYTMKADGSQHRGFLAHQFQAIYPNSVSGEKDAVDAEGKPVYQAMQASSPEAMADIFAELQSLRKRVALLESK